MWTASVDFSQDESLWVERILRTKSREKVSKKVEEAGGSVAGTRREAAQVFVGGNRALVSGIWVPKQFNIEAA